MGRDTCQRNRGASPPTSETPAGKKSPPSSSLRRDDPDGKTGTSLAVQLRPCASDAGGVGSIPGWGTRSHMAKKKKKERERGSWKTLVCRGEPCILVSPSLSYGAESFQSCPTLCDTIDCSPPGTSVHGILQARILEWVTISFSRGSS